MSPLNSFAYDKKMKQKKQMKTLYPNEKKKQTKYLSFDKSKQLTN